MNISFTASDLGKIRETASQMDRALMQRYRTLAGPLSFLTIPPEQVQHAIIRERQREEEEVCKKIAKMMNINDADIEKAREAGNLYQFLFEKIGEHCQK